MEYLLLEGNSLEVLKELEDNSVDSVVTDPPYGLGKEPNIVEVMKDWIDKGYHEVKSKSGFMGKQWDSFVPQPLLWKEVLRVLKPGGHAIVACGTRTQDWMVASMRFAGFEIRDVITWHYGSGFPKSLDISKALDKQAGAEREIICKNPNARNGGGNVKVVTKNFDSDNITAPATPEAKQWDGWGTALKPATEFFTLARKPLSEKTVAENILKWGVGGINIDGCRIATNEIKETYIYKHKDASMLLANTSEYERHNGNGTSNSLGRFPANLVLDEYAAELLDEQSGITISKRQLIGSGIENDKGNKIYGKYNDIKSVRGHNDTGGASCFFYIAKASKKERNAGLDEFEKSSNTDIGALRDNGRESQPRANNHPTVKPISLIRYMVRMITPPGGTVLDCFNGSGTTGCACALESDLDLIYIGIDLNKDNDGNDAGYLKISEARIEYWKKEAEKLLIKK